MSLEISELTFLIYMLLLAAGTVNEGFSSMNYADLVQKLTSFRITRRRVILYIVVALIAVVVVRFFLPFLLLVGAGWALWGIFEWHDAVDKARPNPKLKDMWRYRKELIMAIWYGPRARRALDHI